MPIFLIAPIAVVPLVFVVAIAERAGNAGVAFVIGALMLVHAMAALGLFRRASIASTVPA